MILPVLACLGVLLIGEGLGTWIGRKIVHIGIGCVVLSVNLTDDHTRLIAIVLGLAVSMATYVSGSKLRIAHGDRDKGICVFALAVAITAAFFPDRPWQLASFFFADPAGAIVGRTLQGPKLHGSKTILGTTAVLLAAYACTRNWYHSACIAAIECFGGAWDNAFILGYILLIS